MAIDEETMKKAAVAVDKSNAAGAFLPNLEPDEMKLVQQKGRELNRQALEMRVPPADLPEEILGKTFEDMTPSLRAAALQWASVLHTQHLAQHKHLTTGV